MILSSKNVFANVGKIHPTKELQKRLENLYQTKSISNHLYLKEQFYTLRMVDRRNFFYRLSILSDIAIVLGAIKVKIEDKDKAVWLLQSLSTCYKHLLPTLIYRKDTMNVEEFSNTLLSKERRLNGGSNEASDDSASTVSN